MMRRWRRDVRGVFLQSHLYKCAGGVLVAGADRTGNIRYQDVVIRRFSTCHQRPATARPSPRARRGEQAGRKPTAARKRTPTARTRCAADRAGQTSNGQDRKHRNVGIRRRRFSTRHQRPATARPSPRGRRGKQAGRTPTAARKRTPTARTRCAADRAGKTTSRRAVAARAIPVLLTPGRWRWHSGSDPVPAAGKNDGLAAVGRPRLLRMATTVCMGMGFVDAGTAARDFRRASGTQVAVV